MDEKVKKVVSEIEKMPLTKEEWDIINNLLSLLSEKEKEIEELKIQQDEQIDNNLKLLNANNILIARINDLEQGIGEVLDGTLPYLAEQRLKKLIEKGEGE